MSKELDDFYAIIESRNNELKKRSDVVQGIFAEQEKAGAQLIAEKTTVGASSQVVLAAKEFAELGVQDKVQAQATKLGINPGESSEVLDAVSEEWKQAKLDSIAKRKNLKDALEVKFFDRPVDYVVAQIGMENTVKQAEAAAARSSEASASFRDIQTLTQNIPGQMAALAKTKTEALIQTKLEGNQAIINQGLLEQKLANAGMQVQGLQVLNQMDAAQVNNLATGVSQRNAQAQLGLAQARFAQDKKMFDLQLQDRLEITARKDADRKDLEDTANVVRKGASITGFPDVSGFPTAKIVNMLNMRDGKFMDFFKVGMQSEATGHPIISDDAGQSARIIMEHNAPLRPEQKVIKDFLVNSYIQAQSPEAAQKGKYDNTKKDQVLQGTRNIAMQGAAEDMKNIKFGDNTNIYSPPPLATVMETGPVKNSVWGKVVMAPQMQGGGLTEFNPEQLVTLTAAAIKSGKIKYDDATVGLQAAFGTARQINNLTRNYVGMGLPPQSGYNTAVANGLGFSKKYNLEDAKDLGLLLNSRMSTFQNAAGTTLGARPFGN